MEKFSLPKVKIRLSTLGWGVGVVVLLGLAGILILAYAWSPARGPLRDLQTRLPLPAAVVDYTHPVTFRELSQNLISVRRFYETQDFSKVGLRVDFSTEDGQKRLKVREKEVLNKMIEDQAVIKLAEDRGIHISDEAIRQGLNRKLEEYGSASEVQANLARLYGWSMEDFERKVVRPSLYEEKLVAEWGKSIDTKAAKDRITQAQKALQGKKTFSDVAKEFSQGETASEGGELGWFAMPDLAPELQSAVSGQKLGVPGDVVESSLGFHILLVEEKKQENGEDLYRLSQIFTKKPLFGDWLTEQMQKMKIFVWSREYRWNAAEARAEFLDENLRNFEKKLLEENTGDPVFLF